MMKKLLFGIGVLAALGASAQNWSETQKVTAPVRAEDDLFGDDVCIRGNRAIVGAYLDDEDGNEANYVEAAGAAYIFHLDEEGVWQLEQKITTNDRDALDTFAECVAISGNYAVGGSYREGEDQNNMNFLPTAGAVWVFERDTTTGIWSQVQKLVPTNRYMEDYFGFDVAIDQNILVVGANKADYDENEDNYLSIAGAAFVFERNELTGEWEQIQKLVASDRESSDQFGYQVSISGEYIVVGAHHEDDDVNGENPLSDSGAAYIFKRNTETGLFEETQKIVASDRSDSDRFSEALEIDGDYIAVGAWADFEDAEGANPLPYCGSAYFFERGMDDVWVEVQKVSASDREEQDYFGRSIAISGSTAVIGAFNEDEDAEGGNTLATAGSAYIFARSAEGVWEETDKIVASDRQAQDNFANAVSISGDYILIGAKEEDEDLDGMNFISESGSAYFFNEQIDAACLIDSDNDGISDCEETEVYFTDPFSADSDSDGLSDGLEINQSGTDPNDPDTDGDGCTDDLEFSNNCPDSTCLTCFGDADDNGEINMADLLVFLSVFGGTCGE